MNFLLVIFHNSSYFSAVDGMKKRGEYVPWPVPRSIPPFDDSVLPERVLAARSLRYLTLARYNRPSEESRLLLKPPKSIRRNSFVARTLKRIHKIFKIRVDSIMVNGWNNEHQNHLNNYLINSDRSQLCTVEYKPRTIAKFRSSK